MLRDTRAVDLTAEELELIDAALQTQEKILSVQSRAGGNSAQSRLADLRALSRRIRARVRKDEPLWSRLRRYVPCFLRKEAC